MKGIIQADMQLTTTIQSLGHLFKDTTKPHSTLPLFVH